MLANNEKKDAGVEGKRGLRQLLGGLKDTQLQPNSDAVVSPLSESASSQMLASIVVNWHKIPDDLKRKMAELVGM